MNPTALIPVAQPGDLQDRVGQLVQRVLDGMTSEETRRAYSHALEMFLGFCIREGNPTLSAELVASTSGRFWVYCPSPGLEANLQHVNLGF